MELDNGYSKLQLTASADASQMSYLHPGQIVVSAEPMKLVTILGSCIAVCLWEPTRRIGGMAHYLLPKWDPNCGTKSPRYGDVAIESLIQKMSALNCRVSLMQARVFGGACVLKAFKHQGKEHLGQKNAELANQVLVQYRIPVAEHDTLGDMTRKITFHTDTGVAVIKHVGNSDGN